MAEASTDGLERTARTDAHRRIALKRRRVAELAALVVAPAIGVAVAGHAAGVGSSRTELRERQISRYDGRTGVVIVGGVTQLTLIVGPPTFRVAGIVDLARVSSAGSDRHALRGEGHG